MTRRILLIAPFLCASLALAEDAKMIRAGIIGLDTSHVEHFTRILNRGPKDPADTAKIEGLKVVAAYPQGSKDIESSTKRVPEYTE
ncbi:MAG: gfo/Idh/MocA family oxidoreductase, partial [Verrucomicrobium sp.]